MIGFKVMTKDGLRGPFQKASILKAIETGVVPLKAKLLDLQANRMILAADLVGVELDSKAEKAEAAVKPEAKAKPKVPPALKPANLVKPEKLDVSVGKAKAGGKRKTDKASPANDATMRVPVEAGVTLGRAGTVLPVQASAKEMGQLKDITELILTDEAAPVRKSNKK